MVLTCCFINCDNLYNAEARTRRPDLAEVAVAEKIGNLATTLREAVGGTPPDLIGLCEVGSQAIGVQLGEAIAPGRYQNIWSGARGAPGLMVLCRRELFEVGRLRTDRSTQSEAARIKWMAVRLGIRSRLQGSLWLVVHPWHSPMSGEQAWLSRVNLWAEFNSFYKEEARNEADAMIIVGDFNCEPGDYPLANQPDEVLVTTREREIARRGWRDALYLYNPMWRLMVEPDAHEDTLAAGYAADQSQGRFGTFRKGSGEGPGWKMVDQMLLTRSLLIGPYLVFQERTLRIARPHGNCSDHSAIGATFEIKGEV